jgi:hypothetical protein
MPEKHWVAMELKFKMLLRHIFETRIEVLIESRGLSARVPGEQFKNPQGDVITFQNLDFFPERDQFASAEEMQAEIDTQSQGKNIHWSNKTNSGMLAFAIATFTDENKKSYYLGRYYKTINPNRVQNDWQHKDIPGGFKFQSKAGQKESSGYKPSQVLTQFQNNNVDSISKQIIAKFGQGSDEVVALNAFLTANKFPITFPKGNIDMAAFRDYFCELLQPLALIMNKPIKGNAGEAADIFFGKGGYKGSTISFNNSETGGLYDSLIVSPQGKQIKLSSKGASGASASVVNLLKSINELKVAPKGAALLTKHKVVVEILKDINAKGHFGAPLKLAVDYKMLTADDAAFAMTLKQYGPQDQIDWAGHSKLEELYNSRQAKNMAVIIPMEHMISAVAYKIAAYINTNTTFSKAASDILNHSALVQMYTNTSETKDTISIDNFNAVYPSETVTGVLLDARKTYMSTQGKGNFTFKILKNGAADAEVADEIAAPAPKPKLKTIVPKDKPALSKISTTRELK